MPRADGIRIPLAPSGSVNAGLSSIGPIFDKQSRSYFSDQWPDSEILNERFDHPFFPLGDFVVRRVTVGPQTLSKLTSDPRQLHVGFLVREITLHVQLPEGVHESEATPVDFRVTWPVKDLDQAARDAAAASARGQEGSELFYESLERLYDLHGPGLFDQLKNMLSSARVSDELALAAIQYTANVKDLQSWQGRLSFLSSALANTEPEIRNAAVAAFLTIGRAAVPSLLSAVASEQVPELRADILAAIREASS